MQFGKPGIVLALANGARAEALPSTAPSTALRVEPWNVRVDTDSAPNVGLERLQEALKVLRALYNDDVELTISARVSLPRGLGSSAALGVALLRAMDEARGVTRSDEDLFERSLVWERVFHRHPSGVDSAMAIHGGLALVKSGLPMTVQRISTRARMRIVIANCERGFEVLPRDSLERMRDRDCEHFDEIMAAIELVVLQARVALEEGNMKQLGRLMTLNQHLLMQLSLSTAALDEMITAALEAGALGAKLTGHGEGGCMIALVAISPVRPSNAFLLRWDETCTRFLSLRVNIART